MPFGFALLAAALSGFVALSYEILWYRVFSFTSGGAAATFPLLLAAYLVGIAEGAWFARTLCDRPSDRTVRLRTLAGFAICVNAFGFLVIPALARIVGFTVWGWALPIVGMSAAMLGAILPLVSHLAIAPDERVGARLSYVYAANIAGSTLGSLLTGYVLMEFWDTQTIARFLVVVGFVLAAVLALAAVRGRERLMWVGGIAVLALSAVGLGPYLHAGLYERLLFKERYQGARFERLIENRHGVIAVTAEQHVFGGGIYDGMARIAVDNDENHLVRAFAIPALHASPKRVLMIGLGTGAWTQVIAGLPQVEDVTVIDINPGYLELIPHYPDVASLLRNPKVHVVIDDGRRWLARHPTERFDVVVSNSTFNWRAYTSQLLSVEFMELVRDHLQPNGLFYFNTTDAAGAFRSAFEVFPHGVRFLNFAAVSMGPVIFNATRWHDALLGYRLDGAAPFDTVSVAGNRRLAAFLSMPRDPKGWYGQPMLEPRSSMLRRMAQATPITDDNMGTEWLAVYPALYVP
jgi:spermidine synthase